MSLSCGDTSCESGKLTTFTWSFVEFSENPFSLGHLHSFSRSSISPLEICYQVKALLKVHENSEIHNDARPRQKALLE